MIINDRLMTMVNNVVIANYGEYDGTMVVNNMLVNTMVTDG